MLTWSWDPSRGECGSWAVSVSPAWGSELRPRWGWETETGLALTPPLCQQPGARGPVGGALPKLHPRSAPSWERNHIPFTLGALRSAIACVCPSWLLVVGDRWVISETARTTLPLQASRLQGLRTSSKTRGPEGFANQKASMQAPHPGRGTTFRAQAPRAEERECKQQCPLSVASPQCPLMRPRGLTGLLALHPQIP